ncbi:hypothetical protein D3C78_1805440 [compost metagenome]
MNATVGSDHVIVGVQVDRNGRWDDFLPTRGVIRRRNLAGLDQFDKAVIGDLDQVRPAVDVQQDVRARG